MLIGTSAIARGARWNGWSWLLGNRPRPTMIEGDGLVAAVRAAVAGATAEPRELGEAYARLVEGLTLRTRRFAGKTILEFGYHDYFGYFDALRQTSSMCPLRAKAAGAVRHAWAGEWPRARRFWSTTCCPQWVTANGSYPSRDRWPCVWVTTRRCWPRSRRASRGR